MADEPSEQKPDGPPWLDYRPPETIAGRDRAKLATGGALTGVLVVALIGGGIGLMLLGPQAGPPKWPIFLFVISAVIAIGVAIYLWRLQPRTRRRWWWLAALIGAGVMSLIEGACFAGF